MDVEQLMHLVLEPQIGGSIMNCQAEKRPGVSDSFPLYNACPRRPKKVEAKVACQGMVDQLVICIPNVLQDVLPYPLAFDIRKQRDHAIQMIEPAVVTHGLIDVVLHLPAVVAVHRRKQPDEETHRLPAEESANLFLHVSPFEGWCADFTIPKPKLQTNTKPLCLSNSFK